MLLVLAAMLLAPSADAATDAKTLLVINSYSENAPWSQSVADPINRKLGQIESVHLELVNMNSAEIVDSTSYERVCDRIFEVYENRHPNYVILIGNFAFTLRDRIKKIWGDVPMLLISRIGKYAPLNYYFAGFQGENEWENLPEIADIRSNYNMTMILTPDFVNETIELVRGATPGIKKIVFISDNVYTNRSIDKRISKYIKRKHPEIQYEWLKLSDSTIEQYQEYMLNKHPDIGFIISTWSNIENPEDELNITGGNLYQMQSAANPIYTMREAYLSMGAFGGVFHDLDQSSEALSYVIDKMLAGENMRTMPLFMFDSSIPIINHQRMLNMGKSRDMFPENTRYIFRTPTIWEVYRSELIAAAIMLLLIIIGLGIYLNVQRKRITLLKQHALFVKYMPWGYSRAHILYNNQKEIYDIEYSAQDMNEAFLQIIRANQLPGMTWKIFPLDFIAEKTDQLVKTGKPVSFTYHFELSDTYYEFLLCRINPAKLKPGELPRTIDIFANNITKRIKAQSELRTTMRTLDMTLNVARIIPWQWNIEKGVIKYDGLHTFRGLGDPDTRESATPHYKMDEATFVNAIDPDDRERIQAMIQDFKDDKINHARTEFKIAIQRSRKRRVDWVEINAAVTEFDKKGMPKMVLGSLLVITERKRQEEALIAAKEKASESDRMKSAFLANMSHEIRTPLNAIVGFSSLITQTDDKAQKAIYSGIIEHNNDLLLHLINDVLDLAKIESNTLQLNYADTNLNDLMRSIYDTVRLRIASGVVFNMVLGADECNIKTDPNRLSQVLINLLTNAAKFTTKGSITYGYEINDEEIEFFVRDTGIGISKENQDKLFKRFSKLNNFVQGTGLGLSICKSFVEKMGGQIWVKSRGEGKGASFFFTTPYKRADKVEKMQIAEGTIIQAPVKADSDVTILIAEDNESNYILFESMLSKHYKLVHAYNGQEAIEMYKKHNPDLILMDIRMPVLDGFEATREIRKLSSTVPIIAVTAHAFVTEKDKIMKSGFNAYVAKPINQNELMENVRTQLSRKIFVF